MNWSKELESSDSDMNSVTILLFFFFFFFPVIQRVKHKCKFVMAFRFFRSGSCLLLIMYKRNERSFFPLLCFLDFSVNDISYTLLMQLVKMCKDKRF